jgi:uncharacterized protein DUF2490
VLRSISTIALALLFAAPALRGAPYAQSLSSSGTQYQYWPELDYYQKLGDHTRLYAIATYTLGETQELSEAQYGLHVDLFMTEGPPVARIFGAGNLVLDRSLPAMLRLGYRYAQGTDDGAPYSQNRLIAEFTARVHAGGMIVSDRNGVDWRWTDGVWSTRFRNRVYVERPIELKAYEMTPYADAEIYYIISSGYWSGSRWELGLQLPIVPHVTAELYGATQYGWGASDVPPIEALGLNVVLSW